MSAEQLTLDLQPVRRVLVVPNHWEPCFHVIYDDRRTFAHGEQQCSFPTVAEAIDFARARGVDPDIDPTCRWWDHRLGRPRL